MYQNCVVKINVAFNLRIKQIFLPIGLLYRLPVSLAWAILQVF